MPNEFVEAVKEIVANYPVGDPVKESTQMGPQVSKDQWETVQSYIQKGIDEGATLIAGGLGKPEGLETGYFSQLTVFSNVKNDMVIAQEESGVQLAKYGLQTSVFFKMDQRNLQENDAIVFDTDSRAMAAEEAKNVVADVTQFLLKEGVTNIYKKIDSTMRGSIGAELVGMQQELQADFIIISPGYPKNHRQVIDGYHYLKGKKLAETEIALDPVTPVHESRSMKKSIYLLVVVVRQNY